MCETTRGKWKFRPLALLTSCLLSIFFLTGKPASAEPAEPAALEEAWTDLRHLSTESIGSGAYAPVIKVAPDHSLMVMYNHEVEEVGGGTSYIPYFGRSADGGRTWTSGRAHTGTEESAAHVTFAFDSSSQAHAVWRTESGLWYAPESAWPTPGTAIALSNDRRIDNPAIAVDADGTIFVVWLQAVSENNNARDVYYSYSRDGGMTWDPDPPDNELTTVGDNSGSAAPDVTFDADGDVHVVWQESFPVTYPDTGFRNEILHLKGARSQAGVYQWSSEPDLVSDSHPSDPGQDTSSSSFQPAIVPDGNNLHVVYEDRHDAGDQGDQANASIAPYYVGYVSGTGWLKPTDITSNEDFFVNTRLPFYLGTAVAACDGNVYVYFHGSLSLNSPELIWGIEYEDGWRKAEAVTTANGRHTNPALACRDNIVYLAFERIISSGINHQIYFAASRPNEIFLPVTFRWW